MRKIFGWLSASLVLLASIAQAGTVQEVRVVSRTAEAIGVHVTRDPESKKQPLYRVIYDGKALVEKRDLPVGPFEIPTKRSGVYELEIFLEKKGQAGAPAKKVLLWTQSLFAVRHDKLDDPALRERLAHEFAPVPLFADGEEYFPSSLPYIANEEAPDPALGREMFKIKSFRSLRPGSTSYEDFATTLVTRFDSTAKLDMTRLSLKGVVPKYSRLRKRTGIPEETTLYYSVLEDPDSAKAFINYHFFYAFDPKGGTSAKPKAGAHIFDRESVTVVLDTQSLEPEAVVFGAHLPIQTMGFFDSDGKKVFEWNGGRVRVPWDRVDKVSGHPIAAVAKGSHGMYPLPGLYAVIEGKIKLLTEIAGGNRILLPPKLSGKLGNLADAPVAALPYKLLNLGLHKVVSDSWNRLLLFSGTLVDVPGPLNATFPPFTSRERDPATYTGEAAVWPAGPIRNAARDQMKLVLEVLE